MMTKEYVVQSVKNSVSEVKVVTQLVFERRGLWPVPERSVTCNLVERSVSQNSTSSKDQSSFILVNIRN